jgi:hypothetical protein
LSGEEISLLLLRCSIVVDTCSSGVPPDGSIFDEVIASVALLDPPLSLDDEGAGDLDFMGATALDAVEAMSEYEAVIVVLPSGRMVTTGIQEVAAAHPNAIVDGS